MIESLNPKKLANHGIPSAIDAAVPLQEIKIAMKIAVAVARESRIHTSFGTEFCDSALRPNARKAIPPANGALDISLLRFSFRGVSNSGPNARNTYCHHLDLELRPSRRAEV